MPHQDVIRPRNTIMARKSQRTKWGLFEKRWSGKPFRRRRHPNGALSDVTEPVIGRWRKERSRWRSSQGAREWGQGGGWAPRLERQAGVRWRAQDSWGRSSESRGAQARCEGRHGEGAQSTRSTCIGSQLGHFATWAGGTLLWLHFCTCKVETLRVPDSQCRQRIN